MVPSYVISSINLTNEFLIVGHTIEVHDHHFIPRTQIFTCQLNGLEPSEFELAVLKERTFWSRLPRWALGILYEHSGCLGRQHDVADAVPDQ